MVVTENRLMFSKALDCSGEVKDKNFIAKHLRDIIMEVGPSNVVQVVIDNVAVCKEKSFLIKAYIPSIYWTPCVVHTLNLALKNIYSAKNIERNSVAYQQCS